MNTTSTTGLTTSGYISTQGTGVLNINGNSSTTWIDTSRFYDSSSFHANLLASNLHPSITNLNTNNMPVTQTKVAVFEVTRNDKNEITDTKFIKELWVQTKNGTSLDFQVAKDADIAKYDSEAISIRIIHTLSF